MAGKPAEIIKAAEGRGVGIVVSEEIVGEISYVLAYPTLKKFYQNEVMRREDLIGVVPKVGKIFKGARKVNVVLDRPADDKFIECALAASAGYIVSGDRHLLRVASYKKIWMLSVGEFLQVMEAR